MSTYRQLLEEARETFRANGIFEYESNAYILFEEAFGLNRLDYLMKGNEKPCEDKVKVYKEYIFRRIQGEPIQYITGKADFCGLRFNVNSDVLIPRFDTEVLVSKALEYVKPDSNVLDMCTGSGCIIISISKLSGAKHCTGVDISSKALRIASENAKQNKADISLIESDLFEKVLGKYDVIVSNPPYITDAEMEELLDEVKLKEPTIALRGGEDGLKFYRKIISQAKEYLKPDGMLLFEIGCNQADAVRMLMKDNGYKNIEVIKDLAGLDRVVIGGI